MAIFKRKYLEAVTSGRKTQTRRTHKGEWKIGRRYSIRARWFDKPEAKILVTRKFKQRLGDITQEDALKEGFNTIQEFREAWTEINGSWNPDQIVTVYEFTLQEGLRQNK